MLEMELISRRIWKFGLVFFTYSGIDGFVRKVRIKIVILVYDRSIYKFCLIVIKEELSNEI